MKEKNKFLPLYYQAQQATEKAVIYLLQKLSGNERYDTVFYRENQELINGFSEQIMNIHNEIVKQHNWAFNQLVKAMERSCVPSFITKETKSD